MNPIHRAQTILQIKYAVNNLGHRFYDVNFTEEDLTVFLYALPSFDKDADLLPLIYAIKYAIAVSRCNEISLLKLNLFICKCNHRE